MTFLLPPISLGVEKHWCVFGATAASSKLAALTVGVAVQCYCGNWGRFARLLLNPLIWCGLCRFDGIGVGCTQL